MGIYFISFLAREKNSYKLINQDLTTRHDIIVCVGMNNNSDCLATIKQNRTISVVCLSYHRLAWITGFLVQGQS